MAHDRRFCTFVKAADFLLDIGVGLRDAPVLAKVLGPGFDHEPFDDPLRIGSVLGDAPAIRPVATAFVRKLRQCVQEVRTLGFVDFILDEDEDRTAVVVDKCGDQRFGPMV